MNKQKYNQLIAERKKYNQNILNELQNYIDENPSVRFGQALHNLWLGRYNSLDKLDLNSVIYNEEPSKIFTMMVKGTN